MFGICDHDRKRYLDRDADTTGSSADASVAAPRHPDADGKITRSCERTPETCCIAPQAQLYRLDLAPFSLSSPRKAKTGTVPDCGRVHAAGDCPRFREVAVEIAVRIL